uniref:Smr domain-containing protein n=1 Tax=Aegilops tauschii TaxID=37682 RepID=M8CP85_AEGTA
MSLPQTSTLCRCSWATSNANPTGHGLYTTNKTGDAFQSRNLPEIILSSLLAPASYLFPPQPPRSLPRRAAAGALGPEFRRARSTKNISKRNNRGAGGQERGARASSAAAGRCVDKLLRVAPEDRRALGASLSSFRGELVGPDDYCHVLRELGDRDKSALRALEVFHAALPLVGNGSVDKGKLLTAAIGALGKMGRPDLARRGFDSGIAGGYGKTVFAYSALISAYARSGLATEAMGVLESMKGAGLRPTTVTYNAVIDACGKGGVDLRFTLGYFRQMLRDGLCPDRKTFNSLLSACSRAGHLEDARAVFDEMIHLGIGRDIYTYNTFIDAICKCGNIELAMQVLLDMEAKKLKPNVVTYSTLIDGYSKLEKYEEALKLYEKMKSLGIRLDRVCYNTVLAIYVKTGKYAEIAIVCDEMEDSGIEKDTVTYNSLINGYGKQGRLDIVSFLVQDMRRRGVAPSVLTYSTLIDIYSKAGMHGDAFNVYLDFKESGLKADVVLFSSFIDTLAKNGLVEWALSLLNDMTEMGIKPNVESGLKADVVLFSSFIDTLAKNGLVEWALSLLNDMTEMGIKPNVVTYNTIIDAFGKSKVHAEEDPEVGEMGIVGVYNGQIIRAANPVTRGRSAIDVRMRRSQELYFILELFQKMVQQGVRPNVVTFSAILNACSRCNNFEDAALLLEQLRLFDNFVYGVAYGLLMGYQEIWSQAQSLFNQLGRMDSPTSSAFYNALTDMLWHFGQRQGAQLIVLEGVNRRVWENTWTQAMVHAWLLNVRSIVFEGRAMPEFVSILTGWGKHSKIAGASTLRHVIEALLNSIGAPFQVERFNIGSVPFKFQLLSSRLGKRSLMRIHPIGPPALDGLSLRRQHGPGRYLELWFRQVPWMDDADTSTGWFPPLARDAALQDAMSFAEDANGIPPSMNDEQAACGCVGSSSGWLTRRHGKGKQKGVEEMSAMCRLLIHSFSCHGSFLNNWTWSWGIVNHSKCIFSIARSFKKDFRSHRKSPRVPTNVDLVSKSTTKKGSTLIIYLIYAQIKTMLRDKEMSDAMFQIRPLKAQGPDGFPAQVFQKHWGILKNDIIAAKSSTLTWRGHEDVDPFKILRIWIGKASRLYIFG